MDELARQAEAQRQTTQLNGAEEARIQSLLAGNDAIGKAVIEAAKARINAHDTISERTVKAEIINPSSPLAMSVDNLNVTAFSGKDTEVLAAKLAAKLDTQIKAIEQLTKTLTEQEAPEGVEDVSVNNLAELLQPLRDIHTAISRINITPSVNVPAPVVTVDAPDLAPLLAELKAQAVLLKKISAIKPPAFDTTALEIATSSVRSSIEGLRFPVPNFVQDPLIRYKVVDEFDNGIAASVKYYGFTDPEGHWYILKVDPSSNPKTYRYAKGTGTTAAGDYPTNWTNRASLTYDYWYQVFA